MKALNVEKKCKVCYYGSCTHYTNKYISRYQIEHFLGRLNEEKETITTLMPKEIRDECFAFNHMTEEEQSESLKNDFGRDLTDKQILVYPCTKPACFKPN